MKKRYNNYDLLRIISCIAVIVIHVSHGFLSEKGLLSNNPSYYLVIIWNTLSRFAVPVFIMLSGAFILSNDNNKKYDYFYKKSFNKIGVPTIIFSICFFGYYFMIELIQVLMNIQKSSVLLEPIKELMMGCPYYHLWYLYTIILLYLLAPIIIRFKESISKKNYNYSALILLLFSCISALTSSHLLSYDVGFSFYYVSYFMIGDIIKNRYENNKSIKKGLFFITLGIGLLLILCPIHYHYSVLKMNSKQVNLIQGNFNPLIMLASILIFSSFSNFNIKKNFSELSSKVFYIYIFHVIPCDFIFKFLRYKGILNNINPNIVIIIGSIFTFILSIILTIIWLYIFDLIKKIRKKD